MPAGETTAAGPRTCRYALRPARREDVPGLRQVEREAFPEQWPPTRFPAQFGKPHSLYLVAVRAWTPEERAGLEPQREAAAGASLKSRFLSALESAARSVRSNLPPAAGPSPSAEYVAGYAGIWFMADEAHIVALGAREKARRTGVADLLLLGVAEAALKRGSRCVTLEVRTSNAAARALYLKHGFTEAGIRKHYYSDNGEDAVIMTTPPIRGEDYERLHASLARDHEARWGASVRAVE
jgi:ribosomal-protein-alanine N-acetyltransferase